MCELTQDMCFSIQEIVDLLLFKEILQRSQKIFYFFLLCNKSSSLQLKTRVVFLPHLDFLFGLFDEITQLTDICFHYLFIIP